MCRSKITLRKFLKLYGEIIFYRLVIWFIFIAVGRDCFTILGFIKYLIPFYMIQTNFTGCFIIFWLLIPFFNILTGNMTEKCHIYLTLLVLMIYTLIPSVSGFIAGFSVTMNYVSWFAALYMIASYIRLYPKKIFHNLRVWVMMTLMMFIISIASIWFGAWLNITYGKLSPHYFLADANKILALCNSICAFLFFSNLKLQYNSIINAFGSATFGVLLIHAHSDTMRRWLWQELLQNVKVYAMGSGSLLLLHSIGSVTGVFLICSVIDIIRIRTIEKYFLAFVEHKMDFWIRLYRKLEDQICKRCNIRNV